MWNALKSWISKPKPPAPAPEQKPHVPDNACACINCRLKRAVCEILALPVDDVLCVQVLVKAKEPPVQASADPMASAAQKFQGDIEALAAKAKSN